MSAPGNFRDRRRDDWFDPRAVSLANMEQERDLLERSRFRDRREYYDSRFQERERSPLRTAPSDFYRDRPYFAPIHGRYDQDYGRIGPVYGFDQQDLYAQDGGRGVWSGRARFGSRRDSFEAVYDQVDDRRYSERDRDPRRDIEEHGCSPIFSGHGVDYGRPQEEDEVEEVVIDDHEDQDRLQKFFNRPWRPSNRRPESLAGPSAAESPARSVSPGPGPSKAQTPEPSSQLASVSVEPTPLIVPQEVSEALSNWLTKGVSTDESKAISKRTPLEFADKEFSLKPPKLDGYMYRRAKDKGKLKAVNASEEALITTQLKIMDIGAPLIDLYTRILSLGEGETERKAQDLVQDALRQWSRAYHHVTRQRRRSVVGLVEPSFDFLTADPDAFAPGKEARELLFTGKFLESMLKEASQDATLARTSRTKTSFRSRGNGSADHFQSASRHPFVLRPRKTREQLPQRTASERGRPAGASSWLRGGQRYVFIPHCMSPKYPSEEHVGARLIAFAGRWKGITDDRWILESVAHGVKLDFVSSPTQDKIPSPVIMSREMIAVGDKEVGDLVRKRAVREITDGSGGFVCSLFLIPKKSGGFRPIVNLKPLNQFIRYEHFKMENLESARFLLRKGDWMVKLDLKDAYLTVPVCPSHQKFLRFQWKGRLFQFTCLAFGLAPAPRIFTKILKVVVGFLRKKGLRLIIYLDDILILNVSEERTLRDVKVTIRLLKQLGFLINWGKSVLVPTQKLEYLGLVIDSVRLSFALPNAKVTAVKKMCETALAARSTSLREVASLMGNFTWAIPAIPFAQSHYRRLQRFYIRLAQAANFNLKSRCLLSEEARKDLEWWVNNLSKAQDKVFFPNTPDLEIYTDASLSGWGACCNEV
ncbi:uncharacterized protein LOC116925902 [Daphnia magna]|nr:uncharacterized protein LOC116925902 [Daphnia magna]